MNISLNYILIIFFLNFTQKSLLYDDYNYISKNKLSRHYLPVRIKNIMKIKFNKDQNYLIYNFEIKFKNVEKLNL